MNSTTVGLFSYNYLGQRVFEKSASGIKFTVYDDDGRWIGDYDEFGSPIQEIVWLGGMPVALVDSEVKYIEPDGSGTPRLVVDPVRDRPIWSWDSLGESFGTTPPNEDPDGDGVATVLDMRFPGQRYTNVTGMNYSYLRDGYDPKQGASRRRILPALMLEPTVIDMRVMIRFPIRIVWACKVQLIARIPSILPHASRLELSVKRPRRLQFKGDRKQRMLQARPRRLVRRRSWVTRGRSARRTNV